MEKIIEKSYSEMLNKLGEVKNTQLLNGIEVIVKPIPDRDESGVLDTRVKEITKNNPFINKESIEKTFIYKGIPIGVLRKSMGFDNLDISKNIGITCKTVRSNGNNINIRIYYPEGNIEKLPCLVFFHGGGFFGGSMKTVENPCKSIAQNANSVVVSVDYRLAPEHKFPCGVTDCFDVVKWVKSNAKELNIDSMKIGVGGDSAGANLATVCSLMDRDLNTNIINYQALLYPVLLLSDKDVDGYKWSIDDYEINEDQELILKGIKALQESSSDLKIIYTDELNESDTPYVSPLLSTNFSKLPRTLIVTAEFDFLRVQGEVYGQKLRKSNVDTKIIRYKGVDHAFIDKCGFYPQAEDCFNEIAKLINK